MAPTQALTMPSNTALSLNWIYNAWALTTIGLQCCADDYFLGKDWVDLKDPSVTRDHVRKWRILSELKVSMDRHNVTAA